MNGQKSRRSFKQWVDEEQGGPLLVCGLVLALGIYLPLLVSYLSSGKFSSTDYGSLLVPPSIFLVGMFMHNKNPLLWWASFSGTEMIADTKKIAAREMAGEDHNELTDEIAQWVKTCTKGSYIRINPYRYRFRRKGDAAMFKLAWG